MIASMPTTDNNPSHVCIVTGSSRGLGLGLVREWRLRGDTQVLGLSRQAPQGEDTFTHYEHWAMDLSEPLPVAQRLQAWLEARSQTGLQSVTLINNAALLVAPGPLEDAALDSLSASMRVGLEAPAVLTAAFLHATQSWQVKRRVMHISSGLSQRAMAGSAAYCAVKAGLDHMARAQALEQAQRRARGQSAADVVSIAPGVIDTDMQITLRQAPIESFPDRKNFEALAQQGMLEAPQAVAKKLIAFLDSPAFGAKPVADLRTV